jgi:cell fate regulator YaaT (PSP1 superfamily)
MLTVVGVRFKRAGKVYYFDPSGFENLQTDDWVIVETSRGIEAGRVVIPPTQVAEQELGGRLKPIQRRADWRDLTEMERFRLKESEALKTARDKARQYNLPIKVVHAEYNFDGSRLTISFSSERRVDFRELIKDLARVLRTRVEMRQIGVRDEAKLLDGIGRCGLTLCCSTWLSDFPRVSIKTAKNQDLPLNPSEISGVCGRLLCCLTYEDEQYTVIKGELPRVGTKLTSARGSGTVTAINAVRESVTITLENGETIEVTTQALRELAERKEALARGTEKKKP